jgi:hypothetical protein
VPIFFSCDLRWTAQCGLALMCRNIVFLLGVPKQYMMAMQRASSRLKTLLPSRAPSSIEDVYTCARLCHVISHPAVTASSRPHWNERKIGLYAGCTRLMLSDALESQFPSSAQFWPCGVGDLIWQQPIAFKYVPCHGAAQPI